MLTKFGNRTRTWIGIPHAIHYNQFFATNRYFENSRGYYLYLMIMLDT